MDNIPNYALRRARTKHTFWTWSVFELWLYVIVLGLTEIVSDILAPLVGIWLHALLAAIVIYRATTVQDSARQRFFWTFSILPLVRIVSFAISAKALPGVWYYVLAETPLLGATLAARQVFHLSWHDLGVAWPRKWGIVLLTIVTAPFLGLLESYLIHPAALISRLTWGQAIVPSLLLVIFTGLSEELLFRGLLQHYSIKLMSYWLGILYVALAWSLLHIGWHSGGDVFFVFMVGLVWGWIREKTGSIIPTMLAHGLANVVLFLVVPFVK
ncbi:MAG: CPBP family intramembrane glutamic endopeptidase [Sulfobacillus sp.]